MRARCCARLAVPACSPNWMVTDPGAAVAAYDYLVVATEIARRNADTSPMAPSILLATGDAIELPASHLRLTGVSSIKTDYAIDAARRFVRNRAGTGIPYWVCRIAFDAGSDPAPHVLAALRRPYVASSNGVDD